MEITNNPHSVKQLVSDNESLWRRIAAPWISPEKSKRIVSSAAFKGIDISVDIASKSIPERSIKTSAGLVGLLAKVPINLGYLVLEDPKPENPAHALIKGKIRRRHARELANACQWVIEPRFT